MITGERSDIGLDIQLTKINLVKKVTRYPGEPWTPICTRAFNSVALNLDGRGKYIIDGKTILFHKGDLFFFRSNIIHRHDAIGGKPHTYVYTDFETACDDVFEYPPFSTMLMLSNIPALKNDFMNLLDAWDSKKIGYLIHCKELLYRILGAMIHEVAADSMFSRQYKQIENAVRYIHNNYRKNISSGDLAARCNLSTRQLTRLFHKVFDNSPLGYLLEIRLQFARNQLQSITNTIGEISELSGFNSVYSFSRAFKQHFGVSPSECRNRHYNNACDYFEPLNNSINSPRPISRAPNVSL